MKHKNSAQPQAWHTLSLEETCESLNSELNGLTQEEAECRIKSHGPNTLTPPARQGPLRRFLEQFNNVLIYVLLIAATVTAFLEHWLDSSVIIGVVVINAVIGFIQEGKAEKALEAIRNMLTHQALVKRSGKQYSIPAENLVPGDIVSLESGNKVPADLRLLQTKNLAIDEAVLTGESLPANKNGEQIGLDVALADRSCMAYSGTLVTYGTATGIVVATGDATEIGRISAMLRTVPQLTTPLLRQITGFSQWLTLAILIIASLTFAYGWYIQHSSLQELFMSAVGLAVSAIPEGLPAIMTITLAIGVQRMAKRNAIIRRLPAVETLGSVSVICTDKTGTLTRNEMTVRTVYVDHQPFEVSGVGYEPDGQFELNQKAITVTDFPQLIELVRAAALCNNASLAQQNNNWIINGDPTEGALITLAHKAGLDPYILNQEWPRFDSIPFESEHRFMATLHHAADGNALIVVKGAPEKVLAMCDFQRSHGKDIAIDVDSWHPSLIDQAKRGLRLLAIAVKNVSSEQQHITPADIENGLSLLGLVGMIDPPRSDAVIAVRQCQNAGIRVKMITGDHAVTAEAIANQMNIGSKVLRGDELEKMDSRELIEAVRNVDVFARTSPENKLRLVEALQADGHIVAMTGDGVNDAPALKRADIGIAMGHKGTEVAKETSEMVLADDNFASIAHAVIEGRGVYDNLKKSIIFILPSSGGESLTIVAAIVMGQALPITPVQILWVNMVTTVTLALILAFEPPERNIMKRKPRRPNEPLLSGFLVWRIAFVSVIMLVGTFGLFLWERSMGTPIETARTVAVNTLVGFEIFYVINSRYLIDSVLNIHGLFGNWLMWLAIALLIVFQLGFTYWPPMQLLFGTTDIDAHTWNMIIVISASVFLLVEIEKLFIRLITKLKA
ncbi:MAG: cation-transporting P-type ATPase [Gammaproteobacteria bacterium]